MAIDILNRKEHLNIEGLRRIIAIKASINKGLSDELKVEFPNIIPVDRPKVESPSIIDSNWLVGFTDGEGCFNLGITKSNTHKIGTRVEARFILTQHSRDFDLMEKLVQFLGVWSFKEGK